jgi:hypothetical protein
MDSGIPVSWVLSFYLKEEMKRLNSSYSSGSRKEETSTIYDFIQHFQRSKLLAYHDLGARTGARICTSTMFESLPLQLTVSVTPGQPPQAVLLADIVPGDSKIAQALLQFVLCLSDLVPLSPSASPVLVHRTEQLVDIDAASSMKSQYFSWWI